MEKQKKTLEQTIPTDEKILLIGQTHAKGVKAVGGVTGKYYRVAITLKKDGRAKLYGEFRHLGRLQVTIRDFGSEDEAQIQLDADNKRRDTDYSRDSLPIPKQGEITIKSKEAKKKANKTGKRAENPAEAKERNAARMKKA